MTRLRTGRYVPMQGGWLANEHLRDGIIRETAGDPPSLNLMFEQMSVNEVLRHRARLADLEGTNFIARQVNLVVGNVRGLRFGSAMMIKLRRVVPEP